MGEGNTVSATYQNIFQWGTISSVGVDIRLENHLSIIIITRVDTVLL